MMKFTPAIARSKTTKQSITTLWIASLAFAMTMGEVASVSLAAPANVDFTITTSEAVNVTGCPATCPRIAVTVDGQTRYAQYSAGTGSSSLTFSYAPTIGDLDLDGVTLTSPIDLNGGTITDLNGNAITPLTFTIPNTSGVKIDYPSLSMDFANSDYILSGTHYATLPSFLSAAGGTFTRASIGTYYDSSGTLQTAASGVPRFDHDPVTHAPKGILIEEARTNYIRESNFSGLAIGTNSSTANWSFYCPTAQIPGCSLTVTDTGTQNGIPYIDVHYNIPTNTSGSTQWPGFGMPFSNSATVSSGSTTILSSWLGILSYTSTGGTCTIGYSNRSHTTAGAYISEATTYLTGTVPYAYRISPLMTHGATAGKAYFTLYVATPNGVSCDITARLGAPQFELGSFPTSHIPTNGTAVTRQADFLTMPTGGWYNSSESTIFTQYQVPYSTSGQHGVFSLNDGTLSNKTDLRANGQMITSLGGASQENQAVAINIGSTNKVSKGIILNNFSGSSNGGSVITDNAVNVPSVNKLQIGGLDNSPTYGLDGTVEKIRYYPARTSNAQLQLLTQ
ncbi:MAG: hypothetical protein PHX61_03570 [Alphaproteobacteria bacterium]|nr:hypothetical protein [Alphaproteobacteria bacterium]